MTEYCADCDFTYELDQVLSAPESIRQLAGQVAAILQSDAVNLRCRPDLATWSPLEYGCHIRDVLLVQRERVLAGRRCAGAECLPMGREERVEHDGYNEQNPADVARQLLDAALLFANVLARLTAEDWDRTVVYNYPEIRTRSLKWLAVHTLHDVQHHFYDIRRQIA
ncbi:DinB family protein [Mycobacterium sp. HNNTM2301]|uniref:DinB family protein n=1 Tax=Mycobacterium hainanense TaxID=3289775 RepID=UPI0035A5B8DB